MRILDLLKSWDHIDGDRSACFKELTNLHEILSKGLLIEQVTMGTPVWFFDFAPWTPGTGTLLVMRGKSLAAAIQNRGDGVLKLTAFEPLGPTSYHCLSRMGVRDVEGLPNRAPAWHRLQQAPENINCSQDDYSPVWMDVGDEAHILAQYGISEEFLKNHGVPANFTSRELSLLYRQDI